MNITTLFYCWSLTTLLQYSAKFKKNVYGEHGECSITYLFFKFIEKNKEEKYLFTLQISLSIVENKKAYKSKRVSECIWDYCIRCFKVTRTLYRHWIMIICEFIFHNPEVISQETIGTVAYMLKEMYFFFHFVRGFPQRNCLNPWEILQRRLKYYFGCNPCAIRKVGPVVVEIEK